MKTWRHGAWMLGAAVLVSAPAMAWAQADCAGYCSDNITNCTGSNLQWTGATPQASCEAFCTVWDQGATGAMSGDSLECRAYHTGAASGDPATHCSHGGPYGNGPCGGQCATFCAAAVLLCTSTNEIYASEADCLTDCNAFSGATTAFLADSADTSDSFACRGYHLTAAAEDPDTHCQHAGGPNSVQGDSNICAASGSGGSGQGGSSQGGNGSGNSGNTGTGNTGQGGDGQGGDGSGNDGNGGGGASLGADDDSCSVSDPGAPADSRWAWLALAGLGLLVRRRRANG